MHASELRDDAPGGSPVPRTAIDSLAERMMDAPPISVHCSVRYLFGQGNFVVLTCPDGGDDILCGLLENAKRFKEVAKMPGR